MAGDEYGDHPREMPRRTVTLTKGDDAYVLRQMEARRVTRSEIVRDALALHRKQFGDRAQVDVAALREQLKKSEEQQ